MEALLSEVSETARGGAECAENGSMGFSNMEASAFIMRAGSREQKHDWCRLKRDYVGQNWRH